MGGKKLLNRHVELVDILYWSNWNQTEYLVLRMIQTTKETASNRQKEKDDIYVLKDRIPKT